MIRRKVPEIGENAMKTIKTTLRLALTVALTICSYAVLGFCGGELTAESLVLSDEE